MDWIEEKLDYIRKKIRDVSFRKAITAYILITAIAGALLSYVTIVICFRWENQIIVKYGEESSFWQLRLEHDLMPFLLQSYESYTAHDAFVMRILDTVRVWCPFFYGITGSILACFLFFQRRLKKPLHILTYGTEQVGRSNLDFDLTYDSKDEMGKLCSSFEEMRLELIHSNEKMWEMVENQKQLNAAFAHDLRTPLTVLKGYSDFLAKYVPQGKVSEEKMLETLRLMSEHLSRLEHYSMTMKGIRSLDEMPLQKEMVTLDRIQNEVNEVVFALNQIGDVQLKLQKHPETEGQNHIWADSNLMLEVLENLLSNAIRFAKETICVSLSYAKEEQMLTLAVWDDGAGFTDYDLQKALLPYYRNYEKANEKTEEEERSHFGIGLHICRQLCLIHGGELSIANSIVGGAIVTATFCCNEN